MICCNRTNKAAEQRAVVEHALFTSHTTTSSGLLTDQQPHGSFYVFACDIVQFRVHLFAATMPLIIPIKLAILAHIKSTTASQFTQTNCTIPQQDLYNFVSAPNIRSTLDIFWTCLTTIIACTYTVLHLNIPEQRDGRDTCKQGWRATLRRSVKWRWKATKLSLIWTVITILGPEVYTGLAIDDIIDAKRTLRHLSDLPPDKIPISGWTLAHAHYINMGGFSLRTAMGPDTEDFSDEESPPPRLPSSH